MSPHESTVPCELKPSTRKSCAPISVVPEARHAVPALLVVTWTLVAGRCRRRIRFTRPIAHAVVVARQARGVAVGARGEDAHDQRHRQLHEDPLEDPRHARELVVAGCGQIEGIGPVAAARRLEAARSNQLVYVALSGGHPAQRQLALRQEASRFVDQSQKVVADIVAAAAQAASNG